jgi:ubiquinone biosynthesis O-methyltransferase
LRGLLAIGGNPRVRSSRCTASTRYGSFIYATSSARGSAAIRRGHRACPAFQSWISAAAAGSFQSLWPGSVTGIDPAPENIEAAKAHAEGAEVKVDYQTATAEEIAAAGRTFDAVLLLEVVEHVPDVPAFLKLVAPLVEPGGAMVLSTLNRTLKAYALAIIGAEFILRWLPLGTHNWDRFVRPDELRAALEAAGLAVIDTTGMVYNPLADEWSLSPDTDVNYFTTAVQRGHPSP